MSYNLWQVTFSIDANKIGMRFKYLLLKLLNQKCVQHLTSSIVLSLMIPVSLRPLLWLSIIITVKYWKVGQAEYNNGCSI